MEDAQKRTLDITDSLNCFLDYLSRSFDGLEILNRLLDGFEGKLTSTKWAKLAKCSQDTAVRDIQDLVTRGILAKNAAGGRSTSYSIVLP